MASKKSKPEASPTSQSSKKQKAEVLPKPAVKAKTAPAKAAPVKKVAPEISAEAIAQRAYFIAEQRQRTRAPGNPTQDWLEAEKQLKAELKPKKASAKSSE